MKRILLTLLAVVVVLGIFAAIGYTGYRMGYAQGVETAAGDNGFSIRPFDELGPRGMWRHESGFPRGFPRRFDFPVQRFGVLPLFALIVPIFGITLVVLLVYWLFTRNGWRFTRPTPVPEPPAPPSAETEAQE